MRYSVDSIGAASYGMPNLDVPKSQGPHVTVPTKTKGVFYWPLKEGRCPPEEEVNLIGSRIFEGGGQISCRHFVFAYFALQKAFFKTLQSKSDIAAYFADKDIEEVYLNLRNLLHVSDTRSQQFIDNKHFGAWLCDMAHAMQTQKVEQVDALLSLHEHLMALRLRWKRDKVTGAWKICVTCYDPSSTLKHRRIFADFPEELLYNTLEDAFPKVADYALDPNNKDPDITWTRATWDKVRLDSTNDLPYFSPRRSIEDIATALGWTILFGSQATDTALSGLLKIAKARQCDSLRAINTILDMCQLPKEGGIDMIRTESKDALMTWLSMQLSSASNA